MNTFRSTLSKIWTALKNGGSRIVTFAKKRKIVTAVIVLVILGGGYWGYTVMAAGNTGTEYVLSTVTKGPLAVTVTGSGQVDSQDTLNLTPQGSASGQITYIGVTPGQTVKAGQLIAELDMTTAQEAVTSAQQNLESAQISYQQALTSSNTGVTNDTTSLSTDQANNLTTLATVYTNLPTVMTGLNGILFNLSTIPNFTAEENVDAYRNFLNTAESQMYQQEVVNDYEAAQTAYQKVQSEYTAADPNSLSLAQIQQLDSDTLSADKTIETALKDTLSYYNYVSGQVTTSRITAPSQLASQISSLTSYQTTVTGDDTSITNNQTAIATDEQNIAADTQSLSSLDSSAPLNVQTAELNVQKAQESLTEAETNEADYEVRAPFDGVIATVPVNQYDQASSGTTIATLITTEEYVDLSLNEADAAKVVVGQPVTITFDALPTLTMAGSVATIDPVGTVTSGVVTYDVKVSFSEQNSSVKPGMTAEAVITTASEPSAIQVPSAAVTTTGTFSTVKVATLLNASSTLAAAGGTGAGGYTGTRHARTASSTSAYGSFSGGVGAYASSSGAGAIGTSTGSGASSTMMSATTPMTTRSLTVPASEVTIKTVPVTVGISNDTMTEIINGLTPGEYVVTATQSAAAATTKTAAASATSLLGGSSTGRTGAGGFGGGAGGYTGARAGGATGGAAAR